MVPLTTGPRASRYARYVLLAGFVFLGGIELSSRAVMRKTEPRATSLCRRSVMNESEVELERVLYHS